ncbi:hypothetical protein WN55_06514 [Dufourea novaeangliae]|uniref:Uncharacterized protein n=1 Tax=Dufourea novaeangliae TaxID=178035 RepID=A0A154PRK9_DUFNO|nr:hypothetical protein WN55_06514 [Dufourea novaeangliae]
MKDHLREKYDGEKPPCHEKLGKGPNGARTGSLRIYRPRALPTAPSQFPVFDCL